MVGVWVGGIDFAGVCGVEGVPCGGFAAPRYEVVGAPERLTGDGWRGVTA